MENLSDYIWINKRSSIILRAYNFIFLFFPQNFKYDKDEHFLTFDELQINNVKDSYWARPCGLSFFLRARIDRTLKSLVFDREFTTTKEEICIIPLVINCKIINL